MASILLRRQNGDPEAVVAQEFLLETLNDIQRQCGGIAKDSIADIACVFNITRAEVYGVISFYDDYTLLQESAQQPLPEVKICQAEACQAMGARELWQAVSTRLNGSHSVKAVYCLGNCALAPAAMIGDTCLGRVDAGKLVEKLIEKSTH